LFAFRKVTQALPDDQLSVLYQLVSQRQGLRLLPLSLLLLSGLHLLVSQRQGLRFLTLSLLLPSVLHQPAFQRQALRLLAVSLLLLSVLHLLVAYGILYWPNDARRVLYTKAVCSSSEYDPTPSNG
jgi:hypothetical protein